MTVIQEGTGVDWAKLIPPRSVYKAHRVLASWTTVDVESSYVAYDASNWCRTNFGSMVYKAPTFFRFVFCELFSREHPYLVGLDYEKSVWVYEYGFNSVRFYFKNPADAVFFRMSGF